MAALLSAGDVDAQIVREVIPPSVVAFPQSSASTIPPGIPIRLRPTDLRPPIQSEPSPRERASPIASSGISVAPNPQSKAEFSVENRGIEELEPDQPAVTSVLTLADVIASLYRSYPVVLQARLENPRTAGQITEAFGAYDTKARVYSLSEPTGFYRNYRNGVDVARQTWWGGYAYAGYRIGRGFFQPWYQERPTNEGGEFKLALSQPLLQGRAIDPQRLAVFQASVDNRAAQPMVQQEILAAAREAAGLYWAWVAAGGILEAQKELLDLALVRGEQFAAGVEADKFPEIDLIFNQALIAERRGKLLEAEQKFRAVGFKLSLFLRDEIGARMVPSDDWLPERFPTIEPLPDSNFEADLAAALTRRPEPRLLGLEIQRLQLDRQLASNDLLPRIDMLAEGSQDVGTPTSSKNDKGQFELLVGFQGEVPVQRRKARGKLQSTSAKIAQVNEKLRLQRDKIATELLTAHNALRLAAQLVEQEQIALQAAVETLDRYRFAFLRGKTDLIYINFLESKTNETEIKLVDSQRAWFTALADMQVALGLDPLEQSVNIAALPPSTLSGPGHLPQGLSTVPDNFDEDWDLRTVPKEE